MTDAQDPVAEARALLEAAREQWHEVAPGARIFGSKADAVVALERAAPRLLAVLADEVERLRPMPLPREVRDAARRRCPLGGADIQALEHAITITERERDALLDAAEKLMAEGEVKPMYDLLRKAGR